MIAVKNENLGALAQSVQNKLKLVIEIYNSSIYTKFRTDYLEPLFKIKSIKVQVINIKLIFK